MLMTWLTSLLAAASSDESDKELLAALGISSSGPGPSPATRRRGPWTVLELWADTSTEPIYTVDIGGESESYVISMTDSEAAALSEAENLQDSDPGTTDIRVFRHDDVSIDLFEMAERGERPGGDGYEASHALDPFHRVQIYKWDQYDTDWDDWGHDRQKHYLSENIHGQRNPVDEGTLVYLRTSDPSMFEADLELNSDDETEIDEPVVVSTDPKKAPQMNGGDWLVTLKVGPIPKYRLAEIEEEKEVLANAVGVPLSPEEPDFNGEEAAETIFDLIDDFDLNFEGASIWGRNHHIFFLHPNHTRIDTVSVVPFR